MAFIENPLISDDDTNVAQTWLQFIEGSNVSQDLDSAVAGGDQSIAATAPIASELLAVGEGNLLAQGLTGSTIASGQVNGPVMGDLTDSMVGDGNTGVTGDGNTAAFGQANTVVSAENANVGDGALVDAVDSAVSTGEGDAIEIEDSLVSESAVGHSTSQSNDTSVLATGGGVAAAGGDATDTT